MNISKGRKRRCVKRGRVIYTSKTMGNFVETKREVVRQAIDSLLRFHVLDIWWEKSRLG